MIKKSFLKKCSISLCVALMVVQLSACTTNNTEENTTQTSETTEVSENIVTKTLEQNMSQSTSTKENTKEETVYIFTDASGNRTKTLVNEKLNNPEQKQEISDESNLTDIVNLSGDEDYVDNGDGTITWNAAGNTITYQGSSNEESPVDIKVTYYLDDEEVTPEQIKGASGRVKIRFDYTNNEESNLLVNGNVKKGYVPFTVLTGMLLPSDNFSNIEVTNGKTSETNQGCLVVGMAMPGLAESLDETINTSDGEKLLDVEFPEYVEVSADVVDFKLDMIMSVVTTSLLDDINADDLDISEVSDQMDELSDGSKQLEDGTQAIADGTGELAAKVPELLDGTEKLDDGADALLEGADKLSSGANQIKSGANTLKTGVSAYTSGVAQAADGSSTLSSGAASLNSGLSQLKESVNSKIVPSLDALYTGSGQVSAGVDTLVDSVAALPASLEEGKSQVVANANQQLAANADLTAAAGTTVTMDNIDTVIAGFEQLKSQALSAMTLGDDAAAYQAVYSTVYSTIKQTYPTLDDATIASQAQTQTQTQLENLTAEQKAQYAANYRSAATEKFNSLDNAITSLQNAKAQVAGATEALNSVETKLAGSVSAGDLQKLKTGAEAVTNGIGQLKAGIGSFDATELKEAEANNTTTVCLALYKLQAGSSQLASGAAQLNTGLSTLKSKNAELNAGVSTLAAGTVTLADGTVTLANGAASLAKGTNSLNEAAKLLGDGVSQLNSGAITLNDGMIKFNDEGISKITSLVGDDTENFVETIKQLITKGQEYQSFAGKEEDTQGSVTFIIKTEGIE